MATLKTPDTPQAIPEEAPKPTRARAKKAEVASAEAGATTSAAPKSTRPRTAKAVGASTEAVSSPTPEPKTTRARANKSAAPPPAAEAPAAPKTTRARAQTTVATDSTATAKKPAAAKTAAAKKPAAAKAAGAAPAAKAAGAAPAAKAASTAPKASRAKAKAAEPTEPVAAPPVAASAEMPAAPADVVASATPDAGVILDSSNPPEGPSVPAAETSATEVAAAAVPEQAATKLEAADVAPTAVAAPEPGVPLGKRGRPRTKLEDLAPGSEFEGKVLSVAAFGFFVDIGATTDGLVHVSELGQRRMKITDVVKVGEVVRVRVKDVDLAKGRVALTMRPQVPNPMSGMRVGDVLTGKITTITKYGAFVDIDSETEGLVHISELSSGYVAKIEDVVRSGEQVEVRIKEVDPSRSRISLTMVGLSADQARESERQTEHDGREGERSGRRGDEYNRREAEEEIPYEEPERVPTVVELALMRALGQIEGEDGEGSRQNKSGKRKKSGMYDVYTRMLEEYRTEKKG